MQNLKCRSYVVDYHILFFIIKLFRVIFLQISHFPTQKTFKKEKEKEKVG
jgi:hypothetical protein